MTILKQEAQIYGKCIVVIIHQPRNEIVNLFDDLILLSVNISIFTFLNYLEWKISLLRQLFTHVE